MNLIYYFWRNDIFKINIEQININPFSFPNNYIFMHLIDESSVTKSLRSYRTTIHALGKMRVYINYLRRILFRDPGHKAVNEECSALALRPPRSMCVELNPV